MAHEFTRLRTPLGLHFFQADPLLMSACGILAVSLRGGMSAVGRSDLGSHSQSFSFRAGSGFGNLRPFQPGVKWLDKRPLIRVDGPILIFGGPYSNLAATAAVLADAKRLGIAREQTICTGDLTAYCGDPAATIDLMRESGIAVVMGNCDEQLALGADDCGCGFTPGSACEQLSASWLSYASSQVD